MDPEPDLPAAKLVSPRPLLPPQRRPGLRIAPRYRRTAIVLALASLAIPYATGWWIVFWLANAIALGVLGVGRMRARQAAGLHRPGEIATAVAKQAVVVAGTTAASTVVMSLIVAAILTFLVGIAGALFDGCRCDQLANANFHIE